MKALSLLFDVLGKILAFICLVAIILWATDANWHYLPEVISKIVVGIKEWGAFLLVAIVGFEASSKKIWMLIPFLIILAACVIFMFFPGVTESLFGGSGSETEEAAMAVARLF